MEVFEAFVEIDPTLLPPRAILRDALMHVHFEGCRVLPAGTMVEVADGVAWFLRLILGRFRELATNHVRRGQMHKLSNLAQKEMLHKVVGRIALTQNTCTPTSRSLSPSTSASRSHCSGVDARRLDDDASLDAELASLEEDDAWPSTQAVFNEDELDAELLELEKDSGVHPSPGSC